MTFDRLSSLPTDVWSLLLENLELRDFGALRSVTRDLNQRLDQEVLYEHFARRYFPRWSLQIDVYGDSWKRLLQDHNSENGYYRRRMYVPSYWRNNSTMNGFYYVNAVRCMIWDRKDHVVQIGIEAFGELDLGPASCTTIFSATSVEPSGQLLPTKRVIKASRKPNLPPPSLIEILSMGYRSHDLCLLEFDDKLFQGDECGYRFCYGGSSTWQGSENYPCEEFVCQEEFGSLGCWFDPRKGNGDFVPRGTPRLERSDIAEWPVSLPERVVVKQGEGRWGCTAMDHDDKIY